MVADDDDDVPGRLLRPLFIAMGNFLKKVGTAMAPTGRHNERYAFFIAFSTRLINERVHILYMSDILKIHLKASPPPRPKMALTAWFAPGVTPKGHCWHRAAQFEQQLL